MITDIEKVDKKTKSQEWRHLHVTQEELSKLVELAKGSIGCYPLYRRLLSTLQAKKIDLAKERDLQHADMLKKLPKSD